MQGRGVHASVQGGQHETDQAQASEECPEVRLSESDDDQWTDDCAHAVAAVADAQTVRATVERGARDQRVDGNVERTKAEPDDHHAGEK